MPVDKFQLETALLVAKGYLKSDPVEFVERDQQHMDGLSLADVIGRDAAVELVTQFANNERTRQEVMGALENSTSGFNKKVIAEMKKARPHRLSTERAKEAERVKDRERARAEKKKGAGHGR